MPDFLEGPLLDCGPCPYLPGRSFHAFTPQLPAIDGPLYRHLMDLRFRRLGALLYQPRCPGCCECRPIRVEAATFVPRQDQRRCARRNADLRLAWVPRGQDGEREALYRRYQAAVHG